MNLVPLWTFGGAGPLKGHWPCLEFGYDAPCLVPTHNALAQVPNTKNSFHCPLPIASNIIPDLGNLVLTSLVFIPGLPKCPMFNTAVPEKYFG